jgi:hypothetical protein
MWEFQEPENHQEKPTRLNENKNEWHSSKKNFTILEKGKNFFSLKLVWFSQKFHLELMMR